MKNIVLSNNVKEFLGAFEWLESLEYVVVPERIKKLDLNVLSGNKQNYTIYYNGSKSEWKNVKIYKVGKGEDSLERVKSFDDSRVCFYSNEKPKDNLSRYWHYVDEIPAKWSE